jgi:hypothetical protein
MELALRIKWLVETVGHLQVGVNMYELGDSSLD